MASWDRASLLGLGLLALAACAGKTTGDAVPLSELPQVSSDPLDHLTPNAAIYLKIEPKALDSFDSLIERFDELSESSAEELDPIRHGAIAKLVEDLFDKDPSLTAVDYERPWFVGVLPGGLVELERSLSMGLVPLRPSGPEALRVEVLLPARDAGALEGVLQARLSAAMSEPFSARVETSGPFVHIWIEVRPDSGQESAASARSVARPPPRLGHEGRALDRRTPAVESFLAHDGLLAVSASAAGLRIVGALAQWIDLVARADATPDLEQRFLVWSEGLSGLLSTWSLLDPYSLEFEDLSLSFSADASGGVIVDASLTMTEYGQKVHGPEMVSVSLPQMKPRPSFFELVWGIDVAGVLSQARIPKWLASSSAGVADLFDRLGEAGPIGPIAALFNGGGILKWLGDRDPNLEPIITADPKAIEVRFFEEAARGGALSSSAAVSVLFGRLGMPVEQIESGIRELRAILLAMGASSDVRLSEHEHGTLLQWSVNSAIADTYIESTEHRPVRGGRLTLRPSQLPWQGFLDEESLSAEERKHLESMVDIGNVELEWRGGKDQYLARLRWGQGTAPALHETRVANFSPAGVDVESSECQLRLVQVVLEGVEGILSASDEGVSEAMRRARSAYESTLVCAGNHPKLAGDVEWARARADELFGRQPR